MRWGVSSTGTPEGSPGAPFKLTVTARVELAAVVLEGPGVVHLELIALLGEGNAVALSDRVLGDSHLKGTC